MNNFPRIISSLFLIGITADNAFAIPCASTYEHYRKDLIANEYIPIKCQVKNEYLIWDELCENKGGKDQMPYAEWHDKEKNYSFKFPVKATMKRGLCVPANFYYKELEAKQIKQLFHSPNQSTALR